MKKITAIVRPEKLEPLKEALFAAQVGGMTISQVQGCGSQHGWKEYYRGTEVLLNMIPKVKFELVAADDQVQSLVDLILATARTGEVGDGKIFIFPVEEVVRIRTGALLARPFQCMRAAARTREGRRGAGPRLWMFAGGTARFGAAPCHFLLMIYNPN